MAELISIFCEQPIVGGSKGAEGPLGTESHDGRSATHRSGARGGEHATECSVGSKKGALQWQS